MNKTLKKVDNIFNNMSNWLFRIIIAVFLMLLTYWLTRNYSKDLIKEAIKEERDGI